MQTSPRLLPRIDRYILRELAGTFAACVVVLLMVILEQVPMSVLLRPEP